MKPASVNRLAIRANFPQAVAQQPFRAPGIDNLRGAARAALVAEAASKMRGLPIELDGRKLVTQRDAGEYIAKLPKEVHDATTWKTSHLSRLRAD
jgi:hypothetical protein